MYMRALIHKHMYTHMPVVHLVCISLQLLGCMSSSSSSDKQSSPVGLLEEHAGGLGWVGARATEWLWLCVRACVRTCVTHAPPPNPTLPPPYCLPPQSSAGELLVHCSSGQPAEV